MFWLKLVFYPFVLAGWLACWPVWASIIVTKRY
jgi:hypothetical protein